MPPHCTPFTQTLLDRINALPSQDLCIGVLHAQGSGDLPARTHEF